MVRGGARGWDITYVGTSAINAKHRKLKLYLFQRTNSSFFSQPQASKVLKLAIGLRAA